MPADHWSLLETRGDQAVRLEKCTLSIDNASEQLGAYHQDVAFVRVKAAPGADTVLGDGAAAAPPAATIELVDCIARGEAVFLSRRRPAAGPPLLGQRPAGDDASGCSRPAGGARTPQAGESLQVDLRHLTAVVRGGLCRIASSQTGPHPLPLQFSCTDSILLGRAGSPLIEQIGEGDVDDFRQPDHLERRPQLLRRLRRLLVDRPARFRSAAGTDELRGLEEPLGAGAGEPASVRGGGLAEAARGRPAAARHARRPILR